MRISRTLALPLLLLSVSAWCQTPATSDTGHFENWLSEPIWGSDKHTFEVTVQSVRPVIMVFTVAENGFGRRRAFMDSSWTFNVWEDVSAWCWAPSTLFVRTGEARSPTGFYDIDPEELSVIVDAYFRKYASEFEVRGPEQECTRANLSFPGPDNRARVLEILETASSENP